MVSLGLVFVWFCGFSLGGPSLLSCAPFVGIMAFGLASLFERPRQINTQRPDPNILTDPNHGPSPGSR